MSFFASLRLARRWRVCPKCSGEGTDIFDTILRDDFRERACRLCGGDGRVRYSWSVAITTARLGLTDHPDDDFDDRGVRRDAHPEGTT